jgi:hypothetical protein
MKFRNLLGVTSCLLIAFSGASYSQSSSPSFSPPPPSTPFVAPIIPLTGLTGGAVGGALSGGVPVVQGETSKGGDDAIPQTYASDGTCCYRNVATAAKAVQIRELEKQLVAQEARGVPLEDRMALFNKIKELKALQHVKNVIILISAITYVPVKPMRASISIRSTPNRGPLVIDGKEWVWNNGALIRVATNKCRFDECEADGVTKKGVWQLQRERYLSLLAQHNEAMVKYRAQQKILEDAAIRRAGWPPNPPPLTKQEMIERYPNDNFWVDGAFRRGDEAARCNSPAISC